MKRIPKYMWVRWFMWLILFSVAIVCVSLIESRLFLLESLLIVVIVMAVATIVLYEQSALANHLEGKYVPSITEEQFEAAKRLLIEQGEFSKPDDIYEDNYAEMVDAQQEADHVNQMYDDYHNRQRGKKGDSDTTS